MLLFAVSIVCLTAMVIVATVMATKLAGRPAIARIELARMREAQAEHLEKQAAMITNRITSPTTNDLAAVTKLLQQARQLRFLANEADECEVCYGPLDGRGECPCCAPEKTKGGTWA